MAKFIAQRSVEAIPVVILASLLVFAILHLIPGDPVDAMLGSAAAGIGTPEQRAQIEAQINAELGLSDPLPIQYLRWAWNALHLDLGQSYIRHEPVAQLIAERLPSTLELAGAALLLSVILGLLPATGSGGIDRLILPAVVLGYEGVGLIARLTRASLLEVLGLEYIRTARAKGLAGRTIVLRHAMRNALIPIVTIVGLQAGRLLAGSVIVETVFARQGIGQLAIDSINTKDYPVVQGVILLTAIAYVVANLLVDISYGFLNPRIRQGNAAA